MQETWKPIINYERYHVSDLGNIRRNNKLLNPSLDTYGYRQINIYKDGKRYTRKVYRLVLETFSPNIDNKSQIDHINRIRADDRLENLRWATPSENCRNKYGYSEDMHGISWNKKNSKYVVKFIKNNVEQYFGSCFTMEEAKILRDKSLVDDVFIPNKDREMYCISKSASKFRIRVSKNPSVYTNTLEEAKAIRDTLLMGSI
jgi:hypothetical protein